MRVVRDQLAEVRRTIMALRAGMSLVMISHSFLCSIIGTERGC